MKISGRKKKRYIRLKRVFGVSLILLAVLIWNVPGFVRAADGDRIESGTIGSNIEWIINEGESGNYILNILSSSNEDTPDYDASSALWSDSDYVDKITTVRVYGNVTGLGNYIFYNLSNLEYLTMANSVNEIGESIFNSAVTSINSYFYGTESEWALVDVETSSASVIGTPAFLSSDMPTIAPTSTAEPTGSTATPTATSPTSTPTAIATMTPTSSTATPTALPTSTSRATATPTIRPTATPTSRATATPTAAATATTRATATPTSAATATSRATPTATPQFVTPVNNNNNTGGGLYNAYNQGIYYQYQPSNTYDMPRTGDGDAARMIIVVVLFIVGCIEIISSLPKKRA